jgi:protein-disulfide isomerase
MKFAIFLLICLSAAAELNLTNQPTFGKSDAPVTIVEFGDFECPSCRGEAPVLRQFIPELYPDKVRIVFKDFPLESIHPWARAASIAARCVFRQNKQAFWKFYDWDYQNQDEISVDNLKPKVLAWAAKNSMDTLSLERCMDDKATDKEIAENISEGRAAGVKGTPTIFVNGKKAESTQIPALQRMIQAELGAK